MRKIFLLTLLLITFSCIGQEKKQNGFTYENFDAEILKYEPIQKNGVSEKDFNKGVFKINETKYSIKNNPDNLNYADYWNITTAFVNLDESNEKIDIVFRKAIELNSTDICQIIKIFGNAQLDIRIPDTYYPFLKNCSDNKNIESVDIENYAIKNKLNKDLIILFNQIQLNDIKFRFNKPVNWKKQKPLDIINQKLVDSLFAKHNEYIGKSLVGDKFETTMWAIIQHSNIVMMEKYLPIIQEAVENEEIDIVPFKMLIDRIYTIKENYQIFGSQVGVEQANDKIRQQVIKKYKLK